MAHLIVFVEGQTEEAFAWEVLRPHLETSGVWLEHPILVAHCRKHRVVHRGGGRRYEPMRNDIVRTLNQRRYPGVHATTMIDLYAISKHFPGLAGADKLRHVPRQRVEALESAFGADIGDSRFIPHIQLHEFEACLLSDPDAFPAVCPGARSVVAELRKTVDAKGGPELVNDGPDTAPSKRILRLLPHYQKAVHGPLIAAEIGVARIREKCPHFDAWVSRLEALGAVGESSQRPVG